MSKYIIRLLSLFCLVILLYNLFPLSLAHAAGADVPTPISSSPLLPLPPALNPEQRLEPVEGLLLLPSSAITATKSYTITTDNDSDSQADSGDVLSYTIVISNDGSSTATGVTLSDTLDANTSQSGLVSVSPIAFDDRYNAITNPVTLSVPNGVTDTFANDYPGLNPAVSGISSFGGGSLGGAVTDHPAPGTANFGGGGSLTVNPNGSFDFTPAPGFQGVFTFLYRLQNPVGPADGLVSLVVDAPPRVVSTNPVSGAMGIVPSANITINFSESVTATTGSFSLECPTGSSQSFSLSATPASSFVLTPTTSLPGGVVCQVTVLAAQIQDADSNDPPDTMESNYVFSFTVPPDAVDDTYGQTVVGNVSVDSGQIPYSVTGNDNSGSAFTITAYGASSAQGGQVSMVTSGANMGHFTYNPPPGFEGSDSFTYTIGNATGSDTATVTLTVDEMIWFIDNSQASNGDGRLSSPFNNLAAFNTINNGSGNNPAAGDNIFIYSGSSTYAGGVSLLDNQRLLGQGASANLATLTGLTVPSGSASLPGTNGADPVLDNTGGSVIQIEDGNTIAGLSLNANSAVPLVAGIFGSGDGGTTSVDEVSITTSSSGNGVILNNQAGTFSFSNGSISGGNTVGAVGLTGGTGFITFTNTIINRTGGGLIAITNKTGGGVTFSGGSISGSTLNPTPLAAVILLQNNSGGTNINFNNGFSLSTSSGGGVIASGNNGGTQITFGGTNKVLNTGTITAVNLSSNTGATISFSGGGLDIDTTGGAGFSATGGGTINVTGAANNIDTDTGIALDLNGVTIGSGGLAFATTDKNQTGGTVEGIDIDNVGSTGGGTLAVASATIAGTGGTAGGIDISGSSAGMTFTSVTINNTGGAGIALTNNTGVVNINGGTVGASNDPTGNVVDIDQGNANITIAAALTKSTAGRIVEITGRTGGTVNISGNLSCSSACTGINVQNITSGSNTINFSGGTKTLNTGGVPAVTLDNNDAATITFSNGGLDIDTTTGIGFNAINGAVGINVTTGANPNTIDSTTGTALNVASTTIGSSNLIFQSLSSNGGGNSGIILNNTGNSGGLTVTGTGGAGTGGTIQNKTANGVSLNNTQNVSLSFMIINNNDGSGIFGDDVTNFSLINSSVTNNADTATGAEAGLRFNELLGINAITNSTIQGSSEDEVRITPASGVLTNLTVSGSTFGPNSATTGGHGIAWIATGTAQGTVTVTGSTFQNIRSSSVIMNVTDTSVGTLNVSNNIFRDIGVAVTMGTSSSADLNFSITNNTEIVRSISNAIQLVAGSTSTNASQIRGTISGNVIGNGTADSGSRDLYGIALDMRGDQDAVISVNNNNVSNTDINGIFVNSADFGSNGAQNATFDLTVRDNTVGVMDDNSAFPFFAAYGTLVDVRHTTITCMDMAGNTSTGLGGVEHFRVRQRDTSTFRVERLTDGDATPNEIINNVATVESFIAGQNDPGSTVDATLVVGFTEVANGFCRKP